MVQFFREGHVDAPVLVHRRSGARTDDLQLYRRRGSVLNAMGCHDYYSSSIQADPPYPCYTRSLRGVLGGDEHVCVYSLAYAPRVGVHGVVLHPNPLALYGCVSLCVDRK